MSLISGGIGCYCLFTSINLSSEDTKNKLIKTLSLKYGDKRYKSVTSAWNSYQQQYSCCGVASEIDYISIQWFKKQQSYFHRKRRPLSCCPSCEQLFSIHCLTKIPQIPTKQPILSQPFKNDNQLYTEECLTILNICSFNSTYPISTDICHGNVPIPPGVPVSFFLHTNGCLNVIHEKDKKIVKKFTIVSWFYCILNAINGLLVFFIYQRVLIKHAYSTISLDS
uniref:Tetraspanin n=1 Tax=Strongyloides stercoralis TaxID=6248 RepID=A0A0K0EPA4_STRER